MEAINVQEYQRLNESITLCMDACRRLIPQLAQVQQTVAQLTLPFGATQGFQAQVGQTPWANVDPITAAIIQQQLQTQRNLYGAGMVNPMAAIASGWNVPYAAQMGFGNVPGVYGFGGQVPGFGLGAHLAGMGVGGPGMHPFHMQGLGVQHPIAAGIAAQSLGMPWLAQNLFGAGIGAQQPFGAQFGQQLGVPGIGGYPFASTQTQAGQYAGRV